MVKKANIVSAVCKKPFLLIRSASVLHPAVLIFKSVLVWCLIMSNDVVMLITPVERKKEICYEKYLLPGTKSYSVQFYKSMIACIIDITIIFKRLCSEILWCRPNLIRSVKEVLIQSSKELKWENPISCDISCLIIKLMLNWSQDCSADPQLGICIMWFIGVAQTGAATTWDLIFSFSCVVCT